MSDAAYDACLRLARQHYENFPVASWLLPVEARPHIAAVYAFARTADDFADEGARTPDERLALLDDWGRRLHRAVDRARRGDVPAPTAPDATGPDIFDAVAATIRDRDLDPRLFDDLISAFKQDVVVTRYETWSDLMDYARRSANPVGRLVLQVCGYRDASLDLLSDHVCTALQLTNFWQDLAVDWGKGRVYVPAEILRAHGAREDVLATGVLNREWRNALADVSARARALFGDGRAVADRVRGRLRWELRATWLGGVRVLDRLEAAEFDVFRRRPTLGPRDAGYFMRGLVTWNAGRQERPA